MKMYRVKFTYPTSMDSWDEEVNSFSDLDAALKFIEQSEYNSCTRITIYESKNGKFEKVDTVVRDCYGGISAELRSVPEHVYRTFCSTEKWTKVIDCCQLLDDVVHSKWLHGAEIDEYQDKCCEISSELSYPCKVTMLNELIMMLKNLEQYVKGLVDRLPKNVV